MTSPERRGAAGLPEGTTSELSGTGRSARPTRGPGTSVLLDLHEQLAARDLAVLELLAAHRYLTTHHLERFLFHEHATAASGSRTCRRVLARLENWSLLGRPIRRVGGLQAGSASSIWMLTSAGKRLLNLRAGLGAVGRVREPSERFIAHYLAIADTRLQLLDADRSRKLELGTVEIEPIAWRSYLGSGGQKETLKPDLYAVTIVRQPVASWPSSRTIGSSKSTVAPRAFRRCLANAASTRPIAARASSRNRPVYSRWCCGSCRTVGGSMG